MKPSHKKKELLPIKTPLKYRVISITTCYMTNLHSISSLNSALHLNSDFLNKWGTANRGYHKESSWIAFGVFKKQN